MPEEAMIVAIVGIVMFAVMMITIFSLIARAIGNRKVGKREVQQLQEDISQIKAKLDDVREQLADIIIRMG